MSEAEILETLNKKHMADLQSEVYKHDKRHVLNASDVIHAIQLLDKMGYKICKHGNG